MTLIYVVVPVRDDDMPELRRLRRAVARPWLVPYKGYVRYWVPTVEDAEAERAVLAIAGFGSGIDTLDPEA